MVTVDGGGGGAGVKEGIGKRSSPPRLAAPAGTRASFGSSPPRLTAPALPRASSGGSGRRGSPDVCREVLVADGHMEAVPASRAEFRARLEAHFSMLSVSAGTSCANVHEIDCFIDKPKPTCKSARLNEIGLNISEENVFSTTDSYLLDVFAVDWCPLKVVVSTVSMKGPDLCIRLLEHTMGVTQSLRKMLLRHTDSPSKKLSSLGRAEVSIWPGCLRKIQSILILDGTQSLPNI